MRSSTRFSQIARGMWAVLVVAACSVSPPPPTSVPPVPTTPPTSPPTSPPTRVPPAYWPTQGWRATTPEQQGMNSDKLVEMLDAIQKQNYPIHAVVIVRNGYLVLEAYFHPFQAGDRHPLYSATKSFTSALIGSAIQQGYISGVDQKVLDLLPDRTVTNPDAHKQAISL